MRNALRSLLGASLDYAGLFPPAGLSLAEALANYAAYRDSEDSWMLGAFVCPVSRLAEFETAMPPITGEWTIAAIAGEELYRDAQTAVSFNRRLAGLAQIVSLEARYDGLGTIPPSIKSLPLSRGINVYLECPWSGAGLEAVKIAGLRAKLRMGGLSLESFPPPDVAAAWIARCADLGLPFKATAGLHHPIRGLRFLDPGVDQAPVRMHGFLNVLTASALDLRDTAPLTAVLECEDPACFHFGDNTIGWRESRVPASIPPLLQSFGSCSFTEPVRELKDLGFL